MENCLLSMLSTD